MWATRDQFYKCWRKQRLKIEEKERWILMLSSFTFQQEQGKKDRSKLLTWLKMTYNNRVLSSTPPCDHFCARLQRADCWHIFSLLPIHWKRETPYIQIQMNRNSTHHKAPCMHAAGSNAGYVNSNNGVALIRQVGRPGPHNEKDQPPHEAQIQGPEIWKYF